MIDLTKHILPDTVEVNGETYKIETDFTYWIRFSQIAKDRKAKITDFDFIYIGQTKAFKIIDRNPPKDRVAGFLALLGFYQPKEECPKADEDDGDGERALDYTVDGSRIYAAFMQCYGINLIRTPMHWHEFLALLQNVRGTMLNDVMGYRLWEKPSGEKNAYENGMERLKEMWALPPTEEEKETLERFNSRFD